MERIPYEILQLVASWLLPRYQCRMAITSKWCYRYLYTDLLRWHARAAYIQPPRYKHSADKNISLIEHNKKLVLYEQYGSAIYFNDLTNRFMACLVGPFDDDCQNIMDLFDILQIFYSLHDTNILTGCYKYIDKTVLILYLGSRHPLLSMSPHLLGRIMRFLDRTDRQNFIESSMYLDAADIYRS